MSETRDHGQLFMSVLEKLKQTAENQTAYGLRFLALAEFMGTPRADFIYEFPLGFENWEEWERIVCSKIVGITRLTPNSYGQPVLDAVESRKTKKAHERWRKQNLEHYEANLMRNASKHSFTASDWKMLFSVLARNRKVYLQDLRKSLNRIESKHDNFVLGKAHSFPVRQAIILRHWIRFNHDTEHPGLCTVDNGSAAKFVAYFENVHEAEAMSPENFSREKKKLGLISCNKPFYRISMAGDLLSFEPRH